MVLVSQGHTLWHNANGIQCEWSGDFSIPDPFCRGYSAAGVFFFAVDSQPVPAAFKNYLKDRYEYYGPGLPGFDLAAELFPSASR